ncbi:MAG: DUF2459 domain-containing protein [Bacteroidota bacterium]
MKSQEIDFKTAFVALAVSTFLCCKNISASDTVYVAQHAWHTGIVLKTSEISPEMCPGIAKYKKYSYIDISWGDEFYYQHIDPGIGLALRAVLFPTTAVIKYTGIRSSVKHYYKHSNLMQIVLDSGQFNSLCMYISKSFQRDSLNRIILSTAYGKAEHFYLAKRKYHLFRTCNTWVIKAFEKAGLKINSFFVLTSGQLFRRLKKLEQAVFIQKE